jgi:hypothetical protein
MKRTKDLAVGLGQIGTVLTSDTNEQPLIPAFSPYEGEKVNLSLVLEQTSDLDFRGLASSSPSPFQRASRWSRRIEN